MELSIKCLNEQASNIYKSNNEQMERMDSGYDLYYCGEDVVVKPYNDVSDNSELLYNKPTMLGLGIACEPNDVFGYYLYPRSSISKTPLLMANSVGIIDYGYRGEIMGAVKNMSNHPYTVRTGDRLFQLCMADLKPYRVNIVENINSTVRGEGGFGSTNV